MKKVTVVTLAVFFVVSFLIGATTSRANDETFLNHIIPVPGFTDFTDPANPHGGSFDISFVDRDLYYLADRGFAKGTAPGRVDVFDAISDVYLYSIPGFVGNHGSAGGPDPTTGPNGILVLHTGKGWNEKSELWAGDGNSTVKVFDLTKMPPTLIADIATGDKVWGTATSGNRADELAYDAKDGIIVIANDLPGTPPGSKDPFLTFISQKTKTILGTIVYSNSPACSATSCPKGVGPKAVDGLEQPVWDPGTGLFYLAVPETADHSGGEIDVIDPVKQMIVNRFLLPDGCNPHGLALGPTTQRPNHQLGVGCSNSTLAFPHLPFTVIIDDRDGDVLATFTQFGGTDEVWFNEGDNRYYHAASNNWSAWNGTPPAKVAAPVLGIIDAKSLKWIQNIPGGAGAHSVAANATNNHIFFPLTIPNAAGSPSVPPLLQQQGLGLGIAVFEHEGEHEFEHEGEHEFKHEGEHEFKHEEEHAFKHER
jgi:hypothetical protein